MRVNSIFVQGFSLSDELHISITLCEALMQNLIQISLAVSETKYVM
jgi:hypothetical protein